MASENAGGPTQVFTAEDTTGGLVIHADKTASIQGYSPTIVTLIATKSVEISDSGTIFFLNIAGGFTVTMPTLAQVLASEAGSGGDGEGGGFWCKFIVKTAPTTDYIITEDAADSDKCIGLITEAEIDTSSDGPSSSGYTFTKFIASGSASVVGDWVEYASDGVNWYVNGSTQKDGGITLT